MSDALKEFLLKQIQEERTQAIEQTKAEAKITFAKNLLRSTELSEGMISANAGLSLSEVKELAKEIRKAKVAN